MAAVGMATRNPEQMLLGAGASLVIKDHNDPKLWENVLGTTKLAYLTKSLFTKNI